MIARSIATTTHGRYLVVPPAASAASVLLGFHGYGETAEAQMARLQAIPGADRWLLVAVQGLHRFYQRRTNDVVAGWMTRQDRELAIADNLEYVAAVLDSISAEWPSSPSVVVAGFSQGVAMAFRVAASSSRHVSGVISVGGDVPPELDQPSLARVGAALVCRGVRDEWYTAEKFSADLARLGDAAVSTRTLTFDGGHEWSDEVTRAAGEFLGGLEQTTARDPSR
jgi:predicted esterase